MSELQSRSPLMRRAFVLDMAHCVPPARPSQAATPRAATPCATWVSSSLTGNSGRIDGGVIYFGDGATPKPIARGVNNRQHGDLAGAWYASLALMVSHYPSSQLEERIRSLHETLRLEHASLQRIAVAIYDADSDVLKTFIYSSTEANPLALYEAHLADVPSLVDVAKSGKPRVIADLSSLDGSLSEHTQRIRQSGFRSSYTVPVYDEARLLAFLFFNSEEPNFFSPAVLLRFQIYTDLISLLVLNEVRPIRTLRAAVNTARGFAGHRDAETGNHLDRMGRYARLIARELAPTYGLSDSYLELVLQLSALHDLGKIAVPDHILLKKGRLTDEEFALMQSHVPRGIELVDMLTTEFGLQDIHYGQMLRNIVACHHENYDGTGYPAGLKGQDIPLEARITRVADVFDALTSERPYKKAWTNDEAMKELRDNATTLFDGECVAALEKCLDEVRTIQEQFSQDYLG